MSPSSTVWVPTRETDQQHGQTVMTLIRLCIGAICRSNFFAWTVYMLRNESNWKDSNRPARMRRSVWFLTICTSREASCHMERLICFLTFFAFHTPQAIFYRSSGHEIRKQIFNELQWFYTVMDISSPEWPVTSHNGITRSSSGRSSSNPTLTNPHNLTYEYLE